MGRVPWVGRSAADNGELPVDGRCVPGAYGAGVAGRRGTAVARARRAAAARRRVAAAPCAPGRTSEGVPIFCAGGRLMI